MGIMLDEVASNFRFCGCKHVHSEPLEHANHNLEKDSILGGSASILYDGRLYFAAVGTA
jgi:hypothetical protein